MTGFLTAAGLTGAALWLCRWFGSPQAAERAWRKAQQREDRRAAVSRHPSCAAGTEPSEGVCWALSTALRARGSRLPSDGDPIDVAEAEVLAHTAHYMWRETATEPSYPALGGAS